MADTETGVPRGDTEAGTGKAKPKRANVMDGWASEGEFFQKEFSCESPEQAMRLARRLLTRVQKQGVNVTMSFAENRLKVGLPADGKKFSSAARSIARSLDRAAEGDQPKDDAAA